MFDYEPHDAFLSEEDLDLRNMSWEELFAYWNVWFAQAQATNDEDEEEYSHGVFVSPRRREELLRDYGVAENEPQPKVRVKGN